VRQRAGVAVALLSLLFWNLSLGWRVQRLEAQVKADVSQLEDRQASWEAHLITQGAHVNKFAEVSSDLLEVHTQEIAKITRILGLHTETITNITLILNARKSLDEPKNLVFH
jgi:hypothetical protein